jgi:oligopeptide/dipeptide ABC transporter ATP-binding protein
MKTENSNIVLRVSQLELSIPTFEGPARILNGVNLTVREKEVLGLVGETGSGKTMTALTVAGLIPSPPAVISADQVFFRGENLFELSNKELRQLRARSIAMVFQDPTANLNPLLTVGEQMTDAAMCRMGYGSTLALSPLGRWLPGLHHRRKQAREVALNMLERVGIGDGEKRFKNHPHEFSGGMKQRALIAMALSGNPKLLIADEPTTALDVSIEAQILELVQELIRELNLSVLWITHNLSVVWKLCTQVAVMYSGAIVEQSSTKQLFRDPQHPYTIGLLKALPVGQKSEVRLASIPGTPPNPVDLPLGCRFHTRCPIAVAICSDVDPKLINISPGHEVACHLVSPIG